jgi:hypothetical protein
MRLARPVVVAELRRYTPVYRDIREEHELWDDDRVLAWWLRLRVMADVAYPADAILPRSLPDDVLERLVALHKISRVNGDLYRFRGVDMDRTRKSDHGRAAAEARWRPDAPAYAPALPEQSTSIERAYAQPMPTDTETDTETGIESVEQSYSRAKPPKGRQRVTGFTGPFQP